MTAENLSLKFVPFKTAIDNGFWHNLTKNKLDVYKLDESIVQIRGFYTNGKFTQI